MHHTYISNSSKQKSDSNYPLYFYLFYQVPYFIKRLHPQYHFWALRSPTVPLVHMETPAQYFGFLPNFALI